MVIRRATTEDVNSIARIYHDSVLAAYDGIATNEYLAQRNLADCEKQWSVNVRNDENNVVVAEKNGIIYGLASFGSARDDDVCEFETGELKAVYVSPNEWSRGIGRKLCDYSMTFLSNSGKNAVLLWVLSCNFRAIRFYERAGFTADGKTKAVTMGDRLMAVRYIRTLAS